MKKLLLLSMMCLLALTIRAQRCAVLDFQVWSNITEEEVDGLSYTFRSNFNPTSYTVVERMTVNQVITGFGYTRTDLTLQQMGSGYSVASTSKKQTETGYTDLGLPSGTIWKNYNETGFYTYDEAVSLFGSRLPSKAQWEELKAECQWKWTGSGYKVTGPNGNSIELPAEGIRDCDGRVYYVGSYGSYWSSTPYGSESAWCPNFDSSLVDLFKCGRCYGQSVRLVQD